MRLDEQIYKKKALYYHGSSKEFDELIPQKIGRSDHEVIYVTKSPYYAYKNFLKDDGFLYVCRFTRSLDIFNGNSKIDLYRLKKKIDLSDTEVNILKGSDWLTFDIFTLGNIPNKGYLIDEIYSLRYDGFYNNENISGFNMDGIGIFSKDFIKIIRKYNKEEAEEYIREIRRNIEDDRKKNLVDELLKEYNLTYETRKALRNIDRKELERYGKDWKKFINNTTNII